MSNLLSAIIVIAVVVAVIKKLTSSAGNVRISDLVKTNPASPARRQGYTNYRPHKDITSVTRDMGDKRSPALRDDKNNDWLARQLRDEHRAFKLTSEMFDLKIEHAGHCDAKLLEQFHRRNCDARGVDLANGTTVLKN